MLTAPSDYKYRLDAVLNTLPPDQTKMKQWISQYEYGDRQLYGSVWDQWTHSGVPDLININQITKDLSIANMLFFINSHSHPANLLRVWPGARVIVLTNHKKFSTISQQLKGNDATSLEEHAGNYCEEKYTLLKGPDWPTWTEFDQAGFDLRNIINSYSTNIVSEIQQFYPAYESQHNVIPIDIDGTIFYKQLFVEQMEQLYHALGLGDFNKYMVQDFWQQYINLHQ